MVFKKYIKAYGKLFFLLLIAVAIGLINGFFYSKVFNGFPYPIMKFSLIMIVFWLVFITALSFIFRRFVIEFDTKFIDHTIILCGVFAVFGFAQLQLEQRKNNYEYANFRYTNSRDRINRSIDIFNYYFESMSPPNSNYDFYGKGGNILNDKIILLDSLMKDEDIEKLKEFRNDLETIDFSSEFGVSNLIYEIDDFLRNKEDKNLTESELEKEEGKDYDGIYLFIFLSALVLGFFKISVSILKSIMRPIVGNE